MNLQIICHTSKHMLSRACLSKPCRSILLTSQLWFRLHLLTPRFHVVWVARSLTSQCPSSFLSKRIIPSRFLTITKVEVHGWQWYVLVSALVVEVILIAEDTGVLLVCNLLQSQDTNIQTDASGNRVALDDSPSLGSPERRLEMIRQAWARRRGDWR